MEILGKVFGILCTVFVGLILAAFLGLFLSEGAADLVGAAALAAIF